LAESRARAYLNLTVSFDHNLVDVAPAARFTERLKELLESGYGLPTCARGRPGGPERVSLGGY
jgi:2-oxoacid dehydrogenases acyltransferase (catalytic domain)